MKKENGEYIYSPSDLVNFVQSPFASWMSRLALDHPDQCPEKDPDDPLMNYLAQKGIEHEAAFLDELKLRHPDLVTIEGTDSIEQRKTETLQAMQQGKSVIFQGCLQKDSFRGFADFLVRVDKPSKLGDFSYVAWDTKLSKEVKPYFIIQLCCYSELLAELQGELPDIFSVVLGTQKVETFNTTDFYDYYQAKKAEFLHQQATFASDQMPDPFSYSSHGNWTNYVDALRVQKNHLSLVANITGFQITKLNKANIFTVEQLANTSLKRIEKLDDRIFSKLKQQAEIQCRSASTGKTEFEIITQPEAFNTGLVQLPPHHPADLFWDLEGYPLEEGGLEYLWGCTYFDEKNERQFWERWAHDHQQEKQAFIDFIHFAYERWKQSPGMHIYHYGHYEISVCKRLMGRYGVCEIEVDELLRHNVFIDLYKIVRHGLLLGEPKYSIKNVEHLYRSARDTDVASGGDSVVVYANWRDAPDGLIWEDSKILSDIRDYNIDDCNSTQELVEWLREQQKVHGIQFQNNEFEPEEPVEYELTEKDILERNLLLKAADETLSQEDRNLAAMLAHFIKFHQREHKPMWWRLFERKGMTYEELYDDPDCLVGCVRTDKPPFKASIKARNYCYEYRYDVNQEFRNRRFTSVHILGEDDIKATVESVDTLAGLLTLKSPNELPAYFDVIADEYVSAGVIENSILNTGEEFLKNNHIPKPLKEFLLRQPPDVATDLLLEIERASDQEKLRLIIEAIDALNNSYISIQGPPGTGKTYTASHIILNLLRQGKRIGITSNSHKAINNLMLAVARLIEKAGETYPLMKIEKDVDMAFQNTAIETIESNSNIHDCTTQTPSVTGATAWGFSRGDAKVDYLFIDEAGQVSLANLVAMSSQAKNIVCLGDQMQLPQPLQGTHPGESGMSILDFALKGHDTVLPEMGIFLNRTYRMHQEINAFISEGIYESRLINDPKCDMQEIILNEQAPTLIQKGSGIQYIEVDHNGNKQASSEEVACISQLVQQLKQCHWRNKEGEISPLHPDDIMVVAPFNYQVNELTKVLGDSARVGTVDKFQGQEAPVVIVSMTASKASESARGADFLLNKNRINVAVSRAQVLVIVVASSTLLEGTPIKLADIERANLFYKLTGFN